MMSEAIFQISGLTKVYKSADVEVHALRGIDATLEEGELAVMFWPRGKRIRLSHGRAAFYDCLPMVLKQRRRRWSTSNALTRQFR
jgi:dihydrodipicolinate reductase